MACLNLHFSFKKSHVHVKILNEKCVFFPANLCLFNSQAQLQNLRGQKQVFFSESESFFK